MRALAIGILTGIALQAPQVARAQALPAPEVARLTTDTDWRRSGTPLGTAPAWPVEQSSMTTGS